MRAGSKAMNATRGVRKELQQILKDQNDNDFLTTTSRNTKVGSVIRTKTLQGTALPIMVFLNQGKANEKRTAVHPTKTKSQYVREDIEGLLGDDWESKPYVAPSVEQANQWKTENIYRGGSARYCQFDPRNLDELGPGVSLYFRIIRSLTCNFFVATLLMIPVLYFCNAASKNPSVDTGDLILRDPLNLNYMSIATVGTQNATALPWREEGSNTHSTIDPVSVGYITALIDYLIVLVFSLSVYEMQKYIKKSNNTSGERSISLEEYAVFVQGFPADTTRKEIKDHFENLYSVDKGDWQFAGYCCGFCGKKKPRAAESDYLDRGVIMFPSQADADEAMVSGNTIYEEKGTVIQSSMLPKFHRVSSIDHNLEAPSDVIGSCIAEVSVARRDGILINSMTHLKATTLKLFRAKARVKKCSHDLKGAQTAQEKTGAELKLSYARKRLEMIDTQVTHHFENLDRHCKISERKDSVGAFVVFNNEISRKRCIADHQKASWCCGVLYPKPLEFKTKRLIVKDAPPPSDILWENIEHDRRHLCIRRGITVILVIITLAIGWVITQQSSLLRQRHAANTNLPTYSDCKAAGDFLVNSTLEECRKGNNTGLFCTQCYCIQGTVKAHKNGGVRGMFDFVVDDDECSADGGFAESYVTSQLLSLFGAIVVVVANQALRSIMKALSTFEQYKSVTSSSGALAKKLLVAQLINTAVVILVVNAAITSDDAFSWIFVPFQGFGMFLGEFGDFSKEWYSSVGTPLIVTLCLNVVTPHIAPLAQYYLILPLKRYCCSSRQVTQRDLNHIQAGPQFEITTRYFLFYLY